MALYSDGPTKFNKAFILSFSNKATRAYLKYIRYNLVHDYRSSYCTVEQWLYNSDAPHIKEEFYGYYLGYYHAGPRNMEKCQVWGMMELDKLMRKLAQIYFEMSKNNNWDLKGDQDNGPLMEWKECLKG